MSSDNKSEITIDLTTSIDDKIQFNKDQNQLIQHKAFTSIFTQINNEMLFVKNDRSHGHENNSRGMVYFIDGTRGAGKSTFLRYVTKELTQNNQTSVKLELLIELDPSKVETGEHLFVSLLYKLNTLLEKHRNKIYQSTFEESKYEACRKQFKKLAGGLQLLDERKKPLQEIDSEAFLDWGLERVESGIALADEFKTLLKYSCELLNIDALIISIDDADTDFSKGKQVLETIRRYLDSSYLLIVMTGDLQLYSHLVRDFYYESLGENIFKHDQHRKEEQIKLIDHLETQYLTKLFPLHYRTHLTTLWDLKKQNEYWVKFDKETVPLDEIINKLLKEGMYLKGYRDLELYKEFLLRQPLRSIIQLLQFCTTKEKDKEGNTLFTPERVSEGFRTLFRGSLYNHQVDINALSSGDINSLNDAVFRVILKDGEYDTGCYLRPQPSKESLRNCFVALAAEIPRHCKDSPDNTIDYMLQGLGSITLYNLISETSWSKLDNDQKEQQFRNYFSIGRNDNALNWARHSTGILAGKNGTNIGVIRIPTLINNIENTDSDNKYVPVFLLSRVNITDGDKIKTYASIFNILGIIVSLLSLSERARFQDNKKSMILRELIRHLVPITVSEPPWKEGVFDEDKPPLSHPRDHNSLHLRALVKKFKPLMNSIDEWMRFITENELKLKVKPSSVFIGKVWTRLYFSLLNASIHIQTKNAGIGSIMELYALCLINAFLIEESYYHYTNTDSQPFDRTNPINIDDDTLIKKLESIKEFKEFKEFKIEQFPLTSIIMTCPLILGLIRDNKAIQLLSTISDHNFDQNLGCNIKIFSNLDAYENRYFLKKQNNRIITKKKFNSND